MRQIAPLQAHHGFFILCRKKSVKCFLGFFSIGGEQLPRGFGFIAIDFGLGGCQKSAITLPNIPVTIPVISPNSLEFVHFIQHNCHAVRPATKWQTARTTT